MKIRNYLYFAFAAAGLLGLSSCQSDDFGGDVDAREVNISVGLRFGEDAQTRTILSEEDGNLKSVWEASDKVWVLDQEGNKLGELSIVDGVGEEYARFNGTLTGLPNGNSELQFIYFGRGVNPTQEEHNTRRYVYDFSTQEGTLESLSDMDLLYSTTEVSCDGATAYTDEMGLQRYTAFGHFELIFPDGVSRTSEPITISGQSVFNKLTFKKNTDGGMSTAMGAGAITVIGQAGNDFYVTVIPNEITPTFTVTIDGKEYTGSLASRMWTASEFVRKSHGVGVPVYMEAPAEEVDHTKNPLNKWAESDLVRSGSGASATATFASSYTVTGSYYQFGRNHGYNTVNEATANYGVERSDMASNRNVYPGTGSTTVVSTYYASTINFKNYPTYFFIDDNHDGDYTTPARGDTWAERAAKMGYTNESPCPAGWRLPTVAEYKEIMPVIDDKAGNTGSTAWNTLVQIKTLTDGSKCAFRWSKSTSGSYSYLRIDALMVDDKATASNVDWTDSNVKTRYFKGAGYLNAHRNLWQLNSYGVISTHYTARPMLWGVYDGVTQSNGTVVVSLTQSFMNYGGFYWTSDAVQGALVFVFNSSTGYTLGYYLSTLSKPNAMNIRCVKAD